jgi:hypothetical protein
MRRTLIAGFVACLTLLPTQAYSQSVGPTDPAFADTTDPNSARFELAPAHRTRIREYVARERVAPVRERLTVGATLPADVELRSVPSDWGPWSSRYRYVYSGEQIYLVEPSSRRIVRAID